MLHLISKNKTATADWLKRFRALGPVVLRLFGRHRAASRAGAPKQANALPRISESFEADQVNCRLSASDDKKRTPQGEVDLSEVFAGDHIGDQVHHTEDEEGGPDSEEHRRREVEGQRQVSIHLYHLQSK